MSTWDRFRMLFAPKMVMVPPGHKVLVVQPSSVPYFKQLKSGPWLADFGSQGGYEELFDVVENTLQKNPTTSVIWVIQGNMVTRWTSELPRLATWLRRFHQLRQFRGSQVKAGDVAVVSAAPNSRAFMTLLSSLGVGVHLPGPEGEIVVEVHRPDGIVVGFPGAPFKTKPEQVLRQLNLERAESKESSDAQARLAEIEKRELAYIAKVMKDATPLRQKFFGTAAKDKDLNQLIFDIAEYHKDSDLDELYTRLKNLALYAPVISRNFEPRRGERVMIGPGMDLKIPGGKLNGLELAVFYVNSDDKRLGSDYIKMSFAEAVDMVEKVHQLDGIVFYNDKESYFGIPRQSFDWIRQKYLQK